MIKFSVSMTAELHAALVNASLDHKVSLSREIENTLRESKTVQRHMSEIRAEPESGLLAINPRTIRAKKRTRAGTAARQQPKSGAH